MNGRLDELLSIWAKINMPADIFWCRVMPLKLERNCQPPTCLPLAVDIPCVIMESQTSIYATQLLLLTNITEPLDWIINND